MTDADQLTPDQVTQRQDTLRVLWLVAAERQRQHARWGQQQLPDGTGGQLEELDRDHAQQLCQRATLAGQLTWRLVLEEEVAEALAETDPVALRAELIQVAAVAVQWVEALDRAQDY